MLSVSQETFASYSVCDRLRFATVTLGSHYSLGPRRKSIRKRLDVLVSPFSSVRFPAQLSINPRTFRNFPRKRADFLCSSDCVAEQIQFEPSVQLAGCKGRCVRSLQQPLATAAWPNTLRATT